jgi:carbamoyltransferase
MSFVVRVRENKRALLGAITHVDGTARVQAVSRDANSLFWALLDRFQDLTGIPCLLNTSLNNDAEPIVDSVQDSVVTYLTTGLDYLVIGDCLVIKNTIDWNRSLQELNIAIPPYIQMHQYWGSNRSGQMVSDCELRNTYDEGFHYPISETLYDLLVAASVEPHLNVLLEQFSVPEQEKRILVDDIVQLWERRMVILSPQPCIVSRDGLLAGANGSGYGRKFER